MKVYYKPCYVAEMLKVSVETLSGWRKKTRKTGILHGPPFINIGSDVGPARYPKELLDEWDRGNLKR